MNDLIRWVLMIAVIAGAIGVSHGLIAQGSNCFVARHMQIIRSWIVLNITHTREMSQLSWIAAIAWPALFSSTTNGALAIWR